MPMGILSDEDFESEMVGTSSPLKSEVVRPELKSNNEAKVEDIKRGRVNSDGTGTKEVPPEIREIVAKSAINGEGTHKEIANAFGVSESSVSAYKVGAPSTTTYHSPSSELSSKITDHKVRISTKARNRLISALNEITPQRLEGVKTRDLAAIAKDMASIVKDMEPSNSTNGANAVSNVQFVFMAPKVKDIEDYKFIDVKE